jgi:hypothetical protein
MSDPTPTNGDYLNAINATKYPGNTSAVPDGYTLLLSSTANDQYAQQGFRANAYLNMSTGQTMIAVLGPSTPLDPLGSNSSVLTSEAVKLDLRLANNDTTVTQDMQDISSQFFNEAKTAAAAMDKPFADDFSNVFVTGNSLGATFAQIMSQEHNALAV